MTYEIPEIPKVPKEIIDAVNNQTLAVFIGAGVSRLIGCIGWNQLAYNLVNRCFSTKKKDGSGLINFKEKETLIQEKDHKKTITICYHLLEKNGFESIFYEELEKSLKADEDLVKSQNIYDELYRLRGLFITTNADEHFDDKFEQSRIVWREEDFDPSKIDRTKLYHIHGSIKDKDSLIFTVPEYIKRYNKPTFKKFLEEIFSKYSVLFVGYGMAEFELLDFLITKYDPNKKQNPKHFILLPFYKGEENILEFEQSYYNSMGIKVLPYVKDNKGYGQLYDVIKSWNKEINQASGYLYDSQQEIDDTISNYSKEKAERIFQIIKNDKSQRDYFFEALKSAENPFPWLQPLKEKGYFDPQNWNQNRNVLGYLENVADKIKENQDAEVIETLLEIANKIITYQDEKGERIEKHRTDWLMIKIIFSLPIDKITESHIEFIRLALNSEWIAAWVVYEIDNTILPRLLQERAENLVLNLLDIILSYKKIEEKSYFDDKKTYEHTSIKYISIMDESTINEYQLKETLQKYKQKIAELCSIKAARIAIDKMKIIIKEDKSKFDNMWIPTTEDHPQTISPERYECQLVHFVRDMFEFSEPHKIKEEIDKLLKEEHPIFKRIAIHIINYHYKDLNELFWQLKENPLEDELLKHELYELLKNNCSVFTNEQITKVLNWIESNKNYYIPKDENEDQVNKMIAYKKKEWLSALLETKNRDILSSYEKYNNINPAELDHPGFVFWMGAKVGYKNSVARDEILTKTNEEIAEYFISKKEKKGAEDLFNSFKNYVSENPEKFTNNIKPFLNIPRIYQYALLWGLNKAWSTKKHINWQVVFDFIFNLITSDDFWNENYEGANYRNLIISQIAEVIEEGTKDDNHAFSPKFLPKAEEILLLLAEKTESDFTYTGDLVTSIIDSTKGKIFSAMINYSLRYARLYKREEDKWVRSVKEDFTKRLDREIEPSLEFSLILGKYLPSIYWLDKKWVSYNINKIFPINNDTHWKAAFTGYLSYFSTIYGDIYFLLRENGHYAKAIKTDFDNPDITKRVVQHICIGYLEDWEKLEDEKSLIFQLLEDKNIKQILEIVNYFLVITKTNLFEKNTKDKVIEKIKSKVKPLWKEIYKLTKHDEENEEFQKIISDISKWLVFIDEIDDEIMEWLILSAKYLNRGRCCNDDSFIKYLVKHTSKTPAKVGKIYLEMLKADIYPNYKQEHIKEIVLLLYENNKKEIADKIYNLYGEKSYFFLKDIYGKYNKKGNHNS
jgi:hypothetical protein